MMRLGTFVTRLAADRGGNFAIEFALALPVLLVMMIMLVDAGRYSIQKSAMLQGAREGAQYGSFAPSNTADIAATAQNATGLTGVTADSQVFCECTPGGTHVDCGLSCTGGGNPKKYVSVTTAKSFASALDGASLNFGSFGRWSVPATTTATVIMICP
jgi:Flp pilus assembly protein TadG